MVGRGFVRIEGFEHLELGHEQYFVRGKPELMIKLCRKVASARIKKDIKAAKEAEKNGSVGDQPPIRKMCLKDAQRCTYYVQPNYEIIKEIIKES